METTICAIATSLQEGAINIVRLSGEDAINIAAKIFKGSDLLKKQSHTITYGHIYDNNILIDEVLVSIFHAPKSFTCENIVEINCHGGSIAAQLILKALINNGAVLATPGEFTKRAYLNGRIDLIQAEAISDLLKAESDTNYLHALKALKGYGSSKIKELRQLLLDILANIEVNIDYPEYDDAIEVTGEFLKNELPKAIDAIEKIIENSLKSIYLKEGIKTAIIGQPNAGKSTLLNKMLNEEKAIITAIPGTTRDVVEGAIYVNGIKLLLNDTAGIRKTVDEVENIGIKKSLDLIKDAEFIIYLLNPEDDIKVVKELYEQIKLKKHLVILNKKDLKIKTEFNIEIDMHVSLKNDDIKIIENKICELFGLVDIQNQQLIYITNLEHLRILQEVKQLLNDSLLLSLNLEVDLIEIDIKQAWVSLGMILGIHYEEELLDALFSQFCLGK